MRYRDIRSHMEDRTKKGTLRKRAAQALSTVTVPPATPTRPVTGLVDGQSQDDKWGDVFAKHRHVGGKQSQSLRRARRASRFGQYGIQPMRSRIQRTRRKQRTGGVR